MQHARCFVQLSGDLGTKIAKAPVTPAEVVLLRAIHGPDAVQNVELLNGGVNDKTPHAEELQRLRDHYTALDAEGASIVGKLFPGHSPTLPTTFDEIGLAVGYSEGGEPRSAKGKKAAAKNAAAAKAEAEEDAGTEAGDDDKSED